MTDDYSTTTSLLDAVDELWERRDQLDPQSEPERTLILEMIDLIDAGVARAARVDVDGAVTVDDRVKRAILLGFRVLPMTESSVGGFRYHDRIPLKQHLPGVRMVPGAIARWGSHLEPGVVLMPSFVNIGGYVGAGTLVDTWATVGSCAQIGRNVHLSGGAGIGGVLEPIGAAPVVVEDECFIGSRAQIVEGARVRTGAKIGAGVTLTASTPVYDGETGEQIARGEVPEWSVCVSAVRPREINGVAFGLPCVLVVRRLAPGERHDKLLLDDVFRSHAG